MMDLRDMQLLASLARHRHFARAAEECGISQPAFSARIRNLETALGGPIVHRGNRFMKFTKEGEIAIKWARRLLADAEGMRQEFSAEREALCGEIVVGCIPTTLAWAALAVSVFRSLHNGVRCRLLSRSSRAILQGLQDYSLDAGITYIDEEFPKTMHPVPLYEERFVALVPDALIPDALRGARNFDAEYRLMPDYMSWGDAVSLPLCLLIRDMRNRRILDDIFIGVGAVAEPVMETDDFTIILAQVMAGKVATIAPESLADTFALSPMVRRFILCEPSVSKPIGLLRMEQDSPLLRHFAGVLGEIGHDVV